MIRNDLTSLLAKVEAASGPDRALDEAIALALCDEHRFMQLADAPAGAGFEMYRFGDHGMSSALRVTSSVDAALALCERAYPSGLGWYVVMDTSDMSARLCGPDGEEFNGGGVGLSLPLALCAAILKALLAMDKTDGEGA